ncbi:hypothetical protein [Pseudomonas sp. CIP-10]|uniref:hypothetical protein n=1 Tax=Pseudomonas sp. CIP-10 TaxID=2892442 RepID=UPI001E5B018F|nr:hypothetical protein [Pseudomonas sp. CIP-10]UFH25798.1 hypothetical protein LMH93_20380 [Pseudomonas sp. CIP-10]
MQNVFSGLSELIFRQFMGLSSVDAVPFSWQPASLFIAEAEMSRGESSRQYIWLYRAPWVWLAEGGSADAKVDLQQWQAQQRAILQLRRTHRSGLTLINVDRVNPQVLAERFGFIGSPDGTALAVSPLAPTLSGLFELAAPECWTIYEALEAAAWTPESEPDLRTNVALPSYDGLMDLLNLLNLPKKLSNTINFFERSEQLLASVRDELEASQRSELLQKEENDYLLTQLHKTQEQLEELHRAIVSHKSNSLLLEQSLSTASEKQELLLQEIQEIQSNTLLFTNENDLLISQLHKVQEELESYYLANREILKEMDKSGETLNRTRVVMSRLYNHG